MRIAKNYLKKNASISFLLIFIAFAGFAQQQQFGDLELTVLGNGSQPAVNIPVKAIDPDMQDTTFMFTDQSSQAYFEHLYIYTTTGIHHQKENNKSFEGQVQFYNLAGKLLNQLPANENGTVRWNGVNNTRDKGVYIAKGENGTVLKFIYNQKQIILGVADRPEYNIYKTLEDSFNIYELLADGKGLEFNPFDEYMEEAELVANMLNEVVLEPEIVPDELAAGEIEIIVGGQAAGDSSEVKLVRAGSTDTAYYYTINGMVYFEALSHPFGNFTRSYIAIINSFYADSNLFIEEIHELEIVPGIANNYTFYPNPVIAYYGDLELTVFGYNGIAVKAIDPDLQDTSTVFTVNFVAFFEDLFIHTSGNNPSNIYEVWADGRNVEWEPFNLINEENELLADQINYVMYFPEPVPDATASGEIEILVNGQAAGNNSEIKLVRTEETDTTYWYSNNGLVSFEALSHPFGNFTRDYTVIINSFMADSNWFHQESHNIDIALGSANNFTFTPSPITNEQRTANITLEIILSNANPASQNAEVKTYRLGSTDTTFAYTNEEGIATYSRLVHPFQQDQHEIAINSNLCTENMFIAMAELHNLFVGQNNIEMNPDAVPEYFASGPVRTWNGSALTPSVQVNVWRLNNTIDTLSYTSNAAGLVIYENLPLEGESSQYVFQSFKEAANGNPILTSTDTATLVSGVNPMFNIYLEAISQFITMEGTIRDFYNQINTPSGVGMLVREVNNGPVIGSATTNANGEYTINNIPAGAETEIVMLGTEGNFNRIHAYTFQGVFTYADTLSENMNMLQVPYEMIIPQTENDPAPESLAVNPNLIKQLVGSDEKNAEEFLRNEKRMHLTNFYSSADSAYFFAIEAAIDSLFYGGQGSSTIIVPNQINITTYHQNNYNPLIGFPGELGWNVTRGGGNNTSPLFSNNQGQYILGGSIHITGNTNYLESGIKELMGRVLQMGDTDEPGMMYAGTTSMPNLTERAYHKASNINLTARVETGNEIFPLNGLTTDITEQNDFQTGKLKNMFETTQAQTKSNNTELIEEAEVVIEKKRM